MNKMIKALKRIERSVYPEQYQYMQHIRTWGDLCEYCEGHPEVMYWGDGYCIAAVDSQGNWEIVDLCSQRALSLKKVHEVLNWLKGVCRGDVCIDAREKTSWPLIRLAEKRGHLVILEAERYMWHGEPFWEARIRFSTS